MDTQEIAFPETAKKLFSKSPPEYQAAPSEVCRIDIPHVSLVNEGLLAAPTHGKHFPSCLHSSKVDLYKFSFFVFPPFPQSELDFLRGWHLKRIPEAPAGTTPLVRANNGGIPLSKHL